MQYEEVAQSLREPNSPIKKVFDWPIGSQEAFRVTTLEGHLIEQLNYNPNKGTPSICKISLVDFVLENYKRIRINESIIPVIFCVDIDKRISQKMITKLHFRILLLEMKHLKIG